MQYLSIQSQIFEISKTHSNFACAALFTLNLASLGFRESFPWRDKAQHHNVTSISSSRSEQSVCPVETIQYTQYSITLIESRNRSVSEHTLCKNSRRRIQLENTHHILTSNDGNHELPVTGRMVDDIQNVHSEQTEWPERTITMLQLHASP